MAIRMQDIYFRYLQFNRSNNNLMPVAGALFEHVFFGAVYSVNWSPDGQYVAIGGGGDIIGGYHG